MTCQHNNNNNSTAATIISICMTFNEAGCGSNFRIILHGVHLNYGIDSDLVQPVWINKKLKTNLVAIVEVTIGMDMG